MSAGDMPARGPAPGRLSRLRGVPVAVMWKISRPYLICFVLTSAIVSRWFEPGTFIATGDMGPFIRSGWAPEAGWTWNHSTTGAGSAAYNIARGFEFLLTDVVHALGGSDYSAQWVYYIVIYGFVAVSVAYVARFFVRNEFAVVAAGMFAVLNGFFLTRIPNPLNIISVGSIALITGLALRVAAGRPIAAPWLGIALLPTSFLAFNPPMTIVAYGWAAVGTFVLVILVLGWRSARRLFRWFLFAAPWALAINAWWLFPFGSSFLSGGGAQTNADFTDPSNWAWAQAENQIPNVLTLIANWAWVKPQYLPFAAGLDEPWIVWVRYLIPALVFAAPVLALAKRRRAAFSLLGLSLIFVFLAKGLQPVFADVNLFLYEHAPLFWLFREPMSKLGQLLVIFFAVLIAIGIEGAIARARAVAKRKRESPSTVRRVWPARAGAGIVVAASLAVIAYPYPLYTGSVIPDSRPQLPSAHVRVPDYWTNLAKQINNDPNPGKVLVLPLDDYYQMPTIWGFSGVDSIANLLLTKPVVAPKPSGYFGDVPGFQANVAAVETALLAGDTGAVPRLLQGIGVSQVIVRHDLVNGLPGRTFANAGTLSAGMKQTPGVSQVEGGVLELWKVGDGTSASVRTYDRLISAPASPEAGAATLGTIDGNTAFTAMPAPKGSAAASDPAAPAVSPDVVSWPVPAVRSGHPKTTADFEEGSYTVAQRARAGAVLVPSMRGTNLELTDPTKVLLDGQVVSQRAALSIPVTQPITVLNAGGRNVSLDGWMTQWSPGTPAGGTGKPSVIVGTATPLVGYATTPDQPALSDWGPVRDCNNYEPRLKSELKLRKQMIGSVIELSAADHAACTSATVVGAKPGETFRLRLQSRLIGGKPPAVCIFQPGIAGCVPVPVLSSSPDWAGMEQVFTVDPANKQGVEIVLYANVGERLIPPTTAQYRDVSVERITPVLSTTVSPPQVGQTTVNVSAGSHTIEVTGGPSGSVLSPFGPVQDCYNSGQYDHEQAGISATPLPDEPQPAYQLTARLDRACISADVPSMGSASLYTLALEAQSVAIRDPAWCLYYKGPNTCAAMPPPGRFEGWTPYSATVTPDQSALQSVLYLYGSRDLEGLRKAIVQYRDVSLIPVASPSTVVFAREGPVAPAANSSYQERNPAQYTVEVSGTTPPLSQPKAASGPVTALALTETYAPDWQFQGGEGSSHVALQGWMNGWLLSGEQRSGTLVYRPAITARYLLYLFPVALAGGIAVIVWPRARRRRHASSKRWAQRSGRAVQ